ncbi:MAG: HIT domain-containing protein, partial [Thermoplasmatales archaeon]|nr:HIT domain-containing protein [Thermoplasmatales archaeon]
MFDPGCVFCSEVVRKRNAEIVYEDEATMAFLDHAPVEDGHLLVIPKNHFINVLDIDTEDFMKVQGLVKKLCQPIMNA